MAARAQGHCLTVHHPATENKEVGTWIQLSLYFLNVLTFSNSTTKWRPNCSNHRGQCTVISGNCRNVPFHDAFPTKQLTLLRYSLSDLPFFHPMSDLKLFSSFISSEEQVVSPVQCPSAFFILVFHSLCPIIFPCPRDSACIALDLEWHTTPLHT